MEINSSTSGLDLDAMVNKISADFSKGDVEQKKTSKANIRVNTVQMRDKREKRVQNLTDQMKGVHQNGGACFKVLRVVFKIIDILAKPLSAISMNQLKVDLSKTLEALKDAKNQKGVMVLRLKGDQLLKVIDGLKKFLSEDTDTLNKQDAQAAKESQTILKILDEIEETFKATNKL